ncbi:DUF4392 domain-containing protein [Thalassotalea crassostreae]|uniref:DUF4392 domain-containing protein n=1 Tax=Thalassotalea crassostreae TaxID=1763536 RepID=UPI000B0C57E7|nr:DUF4392 domain-containing protein [Thalassotalea crassostreae]
MQHIEQQEIELSKSIEDLMVALNPRGMKLMQRALESGYYYRAAKTLFSKKGTILIGTGFPVADTFETDGPVGAIALYNALKSLGANPVLVCGNPFFKAIKDDFKCEQMSINDIKNGRQQAKLALQKYQPDVVISIERPGLTAQGHYANMRGEDISARCACFDYFVIDASCPTIAIGDGGNEIGMGKIKDTIKQLDITPSQTSCDELLIADVSNWAAYGIIAFLGKWSNKDLLADVDSLALLKFISKRGSVDGVTRLNELTEDSLPASAGREIIETLRKLTGFA